MRRKAISILMMLAVVMTGGCWDASDLEDLDICTAIVVDYKGGEYAFYAEIVDISTNKKMKRAVRLCRRQSYPVQVKALPKRAMIWTER